MVKKLLLAFAGIIICLYLGAIIGAAIGIAISIIFYAKALLFSGFNLSLAYGDFQQSHHDLLFQWILGMAFMMFVIGAPVVTKDVFKNRANPFSPSYWLGRLPIY